MSRFGRLVLCSSGRNPYPRGARGLSRLIGMGYQAWERHRALLVRSLQAPSAPISWPRQGTPLNGGQIPVNKTVSSAAGGTCKGGLFTIWGVGDLVPKTHISAGMYHRAYRVSRRPSRISIQIALNAFGPQSYVSVQIEVLK
jgi:hypothetical protein